MNNDTQSNKYQLTINNPKEHEITHEKIKDTLILNFKTWKYIAMSDEIGKEGTYHTHIFIYFSSRVRFSMIKKHFPSAHIEKAMGTVTDNINYIKKTGKWADTEKADTSVPDTFEELGERPSDSDGKRGDLSKLYQMISDGMTNAEILATNQDYILCFDKIDKIRTTILIDRYREKIRLDIRVTYVYGPTGTGKTRTLYEKYGFSDVYRVTDYDHPFDNYECQPIICFDEFRSSIKLKDMLLFCDIYPVVLPCRYTNKYACYDTIYIISNWRLEDQYKSAQGSDKESWEAFLRRIHKVVVYEKEGNKTEYESVEAYLRRNEKFVDADEQEVPFK